MILSDLDSIVQWTRKNRNAVAVVMHQLNMPKRLVDSGDVGLYLVAVLQKGTEPFQKYGTAPVEIRMVHLWFHRLAGLNPC